MAVAYSIVPQLGDIGHLFTKPDISPLSDRRVYALLSEMEITISPIDLHNFRGGS